MDLFDKEVKEKEMKLSNEKRRKKNLKILIQSIIRKKNKKNCCSRRCTDFKNYEDKKILPIKQC